MVPRDWNHIRCFLILARRRSLRQAALDLGVDQATVGRRLRAFERELSVKLFVKTSAGYELTSAGATLLPDAETMEQTAISLGRRAVGVADDVSGVVRIAAADAYARAFVLPALAALRAAHPLIETSLIAASAVPANVLRGEADVSVSMIRPSSPDLVVRKLGPMPVGLFASRAYLAGGGPCETAADLERHDLVAYEPASGARCWEALTGAPPAPTRVALRVDSTLMMLAALCEGFGVGPLPTLLAAREPSLARVLPECVYEPPLWAVVHPDLRHAPRIALVIRALADGLATARREGTQSPPLKVVA